LELCVPIKPIFYEIIAECPAFQSGDECINENNSLLIGITWDADRDAPPFKARRVHFLRKNCAKTSKKFDRSKSISLSTTFIETVTST